MTSAVTGVQIGESFVGDGANAAHINTVLGPRNGAVGTAWSTALAGPSAGHQPFVAIIRPGLPVKPATLFVNKATITGDEHGHLHWGPAQAGVAAGVADAVADGVIPAGEVDDLALITAVWVNPAASDPDQIYRNNREAVRTALRAGARAEPALDDVLHARDAPRNPFYSAD
ncbi:formaldehyde-activating enzyme [Prauserella muralis]|uniref:Formaldehyde-activating enzyme n=1 Tax=Prauserella muralis TaxID=588067 RepID=A0A2V4AWM6_9PSEU|nr:formaldehyde-activating enzyme [Prauserella muralis]PXY24661.1 formaldehyde-activating enzyme [Prauserella muralis]TWE27649.1 5,6,7,8-tetrahydromethanopterin hydro-lyase [Prauserella muralis]